MRYVLFVCSEHDGRSQMAQAFLERLAPAGVRAESAGAMRPKQVQPLVLEAMREAGFDLSRQRPRRLLVEMQIHADLAVTIGCGDACPYVATGVEDWALEEPAGLDLNGVRALRADIERLVRALIADRLPAMLGERTPHQFGLMQLMPVLVDEFQGMRSPQEIRSCTDAILGEYNTTPSRSDLLTLAHKRTQNCLRAAVCDPRAATEDRRLAMLPERTTHQLGLMQLLPLLVDEFRDRHSPDRIRACADAILSEYSPAPGRSDLLMLAHKRTQDCLRAEVCRPLDSASL
jgi:protein-tyrosine-phosphatase